MSGGVSGMLLPGTKSLDAHPLKDEMLENFQKVNIDKVCKKVPEKLRKHLIPRELKKYLKVPEFAYYLKLLRTFNTETNKGNLIKLLKYSKEMTETLKKKETYLKGGMANLQEQTREF